MNAGIPLPVVDGLSMSPELRALLRPGEPVDTGGRAHCLPRFFYEIASWAQAKDIRLAEHVCLSELLAVDCLEAPRLLDQFPHYVPCAVTLLARYVEDFRAKAGAAVYIAANGGYRSPAHRLSEPRTPHQWAAAVDIYRVGDAWLNSQSAIEKYGAIARELEGGLCVCPFGHGPGETDDHLHFDLGYTLLVPAHCDESFPVAVEASPPDGQEAAAAPTG